MNIFETEIRFSVGGCQTSVLHALVGARSDDERACIARLLAEASPYWVAERTGSVELEMSFQKVDVSGDTRVLILNDTPDASVDRTRHVSAGILTATADLLKEIEALRIDRHNLDDLIFEIFSDGGAVAANHTGDEDEQDLLLSHAETMAAHFNNLGVEAQALAIVEAFGPIDGRVRLLESAGLLNEFAERVDAMSVFKNPLVGRSDDLACQLVPGFETQDHETLSRLANHHGAGAALNEPFVFEYEGLSFEGIRVRDPDFEEGESIDLKMVDLEPSPLKW